jgi:hypothetical protein
MTMAAPRKTRAPKAAAPAAPTELTHEDALARIAALQKQLDAAAKVTAPPATAADPASDDQLAYIRQLESALVSTRSNATAARRLAERAAQEDVFEVRNAIDMTISIAVRNHRGEEVRVMFPKKGDTQYLTASQILEAQDAYPALFEKGYLAAPDLIPSNINVIEDFGKFLDGLEYDEVHPRINEIDSVEVLMSMYSYIDEQRFITEDDKGMKIIGRGGPQVSRVPIPAKLHIAQTAIAASRKGADDK